MLFSLTGHCVSFCRCQLRLRTELCANNWKWANNCVIACDILYVYFVYLRLLSWAEEPNCKLVTPRQKENFTGDDFIYYFCQWTPWADKHDETSTRSWVAEAADMFAQMCHCPKKHISLQQWIVKQNEVTTKPSWNAGYLNNANWRGAQQWNQSQHVATNAASIMRVGKTDWQQQRLSYFYLDLKTEITIFQWPSDVAHQWFQTILFDAPPQLIKYLSSTFNMYSILLAAISSKRL